MDPSEIERILLYEVRNSRHGSLFTGASAIDLVLRINDAVTKMVERDQTSLVDVEEARVSTHRVLDEMDRERDEAGLSEYQEMSVAGAFARLCPGFWPFC